MFRKKRVRRRKFSTNYESVERTIDEVFEKANKSSDFSTFAPSEENPSLLISFYKTLIDSNILQQSVLPILIEKAPELNGIHDLKKIIPIENIKFSNDPKEIEKSLHDGSLIIYFKNQMDEFA